MAQITATTATATVSHDGTITCLDCYFDLISGQNITRATESMGVYSIQRGPWDSHFVVQDSPPSVPLPGAMLLFCSALAAMAVVKRKR